MGKHEFEWSRDRREKTMYDTWQARQDEKPQGTTIQGSKRWPH